MLIFERALAGKKKNVYGNKDFELAIFLRTNSFLGPTLFYYLNIAIECRHNTIITQVSLACPLGKMRMRVPCRPNTCDHLQTFDAELFLQMNQKKPQV